MSKHIPLMILILAIFLTACGGQETPTAPPVDIQGTAISAAATIMAATQMALPTATFVPPTDMPTLIPLPTFTPELSFSTLPPPLALPSPTAPSSNLGECNSVLSVADAGPTYPVRIQNMTGGELTLSLYLNKNTFGQCGYMPGVPKTGGSYTIDLPTGYWYFFALIDYNNGKSGNSFGNFIVQPGGTDTVKIIKR